MEALKTRIFTTSNTSQLSLTSTLQGSMNEKKSLAETAPTLSSLKSFVADVQDVKDSSKSKLSKKIKNEVKSIFGPKAKVKTSDKMQRLDNKNMKATLRRIDSKIEDRFKQNKEKFIDVAACLSGANLIEKFEDYGLRPKKSMMKRVAVKTSGGLAAIVYIAYVGAPLALTVGPIGFAGVAVASVIQGVYQGLRDNKE